MMYLRLLPTALLVLTARSVSAACSTYVLAQTGDTCATLASLAGISVTQFLRSNPNVTGCDKLSAGTNYCVDPNAASTRASSAAATAPTQQPGSGGLVVTTDGHCGDGYTCAGSEFGDCCSEHGWCGESTEHCGPMCQKPFGICAGSSDTSVATTPTTPAGGVGSTTRVTVTITETRISTTTAPGGGPGGATTRTVTLPGTTVTSGTTRTLTVTLPTTVTSNLTVTRTATQNSPVTVPVTVPVTSIRTVPTTLTVPTTVYNNLPGATITIISRTTATVTSTSISVWEVTQYETETETETKTATVAVTQNIFRTITVISTETTTATRTAAGIPTTVYRTQTEHQTVTITPAPRTTTITRTEVQVLETYITTYRTVQVVNTVTVQVAVPTTVTRTVQVGGNPATVTMFRTVSIIQNGGGSDRTVTLTVIKTITAPGNYIGGATVTVTKTQCSDSWIIGGLGRRWLPW